MRRRDGFESRPTESRRGCSFEVANCDLKVEEWKRRTPLPAFDGSAGKPAQENRISAPRKARRVWETIRFAENGVWKFRVFAWL
jgi:hypothetical protein